MASTSASVQAKRRPADAVAVTRAVAHAHAAFLGLPFDVLRAHYARSVQLGLVGQSMLRSASIARGISGLERLTLGPWARHV